jgi:hypothetical protein
MRRTTKEKKSFTLSRSSVVFLERLRKERKAASTSFVLDELIREAETERRRKATEDAISAYYDSLSDEEVKEQSAWGQFSFEHWKEDGAN